MKLRDKPCIELPEDVDAHCVSLCNLLNRIPELQTIESCCGHFKNPYMVFFICNDLRVLRRLARVADRNYSDGKWVIELCNSDRQPKNVFLLRTHESFKDEKEMTESYYGLLYSIYHWFSDEFDTYFDDTITEQ